MIPTYSKKYLAATTCLTSSMHKKNLIRQCLSFLRLEFNPDDVNDERMPGINSGATFEVDSLWPQRRPAVTDDGGLLATVGVEEQSVGPLRVRSEGERWPGPADIGR